MNITNYITTDFCIGCGVCVSTCPTKHLKISSNSSNQLVILETENKCIEKCNICLTVCPFSNQSENEDTLGNRLYKELPSIQHLPECGYYLNSYVGYHPNNNHRMQSASGGLTSYLLALLLEKEEVDTAIVVEKKNGAPYYSYVCCKNGEEIYNYSRSAYYAIHADAVINQIIEDDTIQKVAIVALPCFSKAIRNACNKKPKLKQKIRYIIGLVCGQQKSHNFATYLAKKNQITNLSSIDYRIKKTQRKNGNYGVLLKSPNGEKEITFSSYAKEWSLKLFTIPACNYCDDIFAETADIVFMDAWLPQYNDSDKGENLIITRSIELNKLLQSIPTVEPISIEEILKSQSTVIKNKRSYIVEHLNIISKKKSYSPNKRTNLLFPPHVLEKYLIRQKYKLSINSDKMWEKSEENYSTFMNWMKDKQVHLLIGFILNKLHSITHQK